MISSELTTQLRDGRYVLDAAATTVAFSTRHMFGTGRVTGTFAATAAAVQVSDDRVVVDATIAAASFSSGNPKRDAKVTSTTFLDAARYPEITFHAERVTSVSGGWTVEGSITARGSIAPATVTVSGVRSDGHTLVVTATATVDRYALAVTAMKGMAAKMLTLDITATFVRV